MSSDPVGEMASVLKHTFNHFRCRKERLWLALTGGNDSRLLLATALATGAKIETFTFAHRLIPSEDVEVAQKLAKIAGVPHHIIGPSQIDVAELEYALWYSLGHSAGLDIDTIAAGLWSGIPGNALVIRGLGFEFGRRFYHGVLHNTAWADARDATMLYRCLARRWLRGHQPSVAPALQEWLDWAALTPVGVDPRDRLYLEQRIGVWCSSNEQALQAAGRRIINPGNGDYLYSRMNSLPSSLKESALWQRRIIEEFAPDLMRVPFTQPSKLRKAVRLAANFCRSVGIRRLDQKINERSAAQK